MRAIPGFENLYALTEDKKVWSFVNSRYIKPHHGAIKLHRNGIRHLLNLDDLLFDVYPEKFLD
jgi:hypothetical protein